MRRVSARYAGWLTRPCYQLDWQNIVDEFESPCTTSAKPGGAPCSLRITACNGYKPDEAWWVRANRTTYIRCTVSVSPDQPAGRRNILVLPDVCAGAISGCRAVAGAAYGCCRTGLHVLYKWLKRRPTARVPTTGDQWINCGAACWTSSAFSASRCMPWPGVVVLAYYPALAWLLLPFTALVAISRLVLGLHYPSDVLAGIVIGATISGLSLSF